MLCGAQMGIIKRIEMDRRGMPYGGPPPAYGRGPPMDRRAAGEGPMHYCDWVLHSLVYFVRQGWSMILGALQAAVGCGPGCCEVLVLAFVHAGVGAGGEVCMWVQLVRCACGARYYDRPSYGYDRCPLSSLALLRKHSGLRHAGQGETLYDDPSRMF